MSLFKQKNFKNKEKEKFEILCDLAMKNKLNVRVKAKFFEQFGKVPLPAMRLKLKSPRVKDKVEAFEIYKNLSFKKQ